MAERKKKNRQEPRATRARTPKRSKSKLTTFELYGKFFNERRIGEEQKLIRPIRDGRLRLNNTRLQRYKNFKERGFC